MDKYFDDKAGYYDLLIGNPVYNRIMWGYSIKEFGSFCDATLRSSSEGWVLDAGCGSLVFTAGSYAAYRARPAVLHLLPLGRDAGGGEGEAEQSGRAAAGECDLFAGGYPGASLPAEEL